VYIPLGGSRGGSWLTHRNLMITMVLGGLWHGPAWTFVIWGGYQGLLLVGHRLARPWLALLEPSDRTHRACWSAVCMIVTFHLVCLGWLIFRAESLEQVSGMLQAIAQRPALPAASFLLPVSLLIVPLWTFQLVQYVAADLDIVARTPWYVRGVFYTGCFYAFILVGEFGGQQFIYFQF
jgi:hypothetical protein